MGWFELECRVVYFNRTIMATCDDDIGAYYRLLTHYYNRSIKLQRPKIGAHITIVSGKHEDFIDKSCWNKYNNIIIKYHPFVETNGEYFWLKVKCEKIHDLREELGLTRNLKHPLHLTIGNLKY